jgi:hypothetical protein
MPGKKIKPLTFLPDIFLPSTACFSARRLHFPRVKL